MGLRAPGRTAGRHDSLAISRGSAGAGPSLPRRHRRPGRRPGRHARDAAGPETGPDPARLGPSAASLTDPKRQRPRPTRKRPRNVRKPGPGRGRGSPEAERPLPFGPAPHAAHRAQLWPSPLQPRGPFLLSPDRQRHIAITGKKHNRCVENRSPRWNHGQGRGHFIPFTGSAKGFPTTRGQLCPALRAGALGSPAEGQRARGRRATSHPSRARRAPPSDSGSCPWSPGRSLSTRPAVPAAAQAFGWNPAPVPRASEGRQSPAAEQRGSGEAGLVRVPPRPRPPAWPAPAARPRPPWASGAPRQAAAESRCEAADHWTLGRTPREGRYLQSPWSPSSSPGLPSTSPRS